MRDPGPGPSGRDRARLEAFGAFAGCWGALHERLTFAAQHERMTVSQRERVAHVVRRCSMAPHATVAADLADPLHNRLPIGGKDVRQEHRLERHDPALDGRDLALGPIPDDAVDRDHALAERGGLILRPRRALARRLGR